MSAAAGQDWPGGQYADVGYTGDDSEAATSVTRAVRRDGRWYDHGTGFEIPSSFVRSVSPLYLVSLDAAVEAAAEQDCEDWENCTVREVHREWARKALTAAVMGGAQ